MFWRWKSILQIYMTDELERKTDNQRGKPFVPIISRTKLQIYITNESKRRPSTHKISRAKFKTLVIKIIEITLYLQTIGSQKLNLLQFDSYILNNTKLITSNKYHLASRYKCVRNEKNKNLGKNPKTKIWISKRNYIWHHTAGHCCKKDLSGCSPSISEFGGKS